MAYSTITQIQMEFKSITISATSPITINMVNEFIKQTDQFIESRIGLRYIVPITGSSSLTLIGMISLTLVAERIKRIIEVKGEDPSKNQTPGRTKREQWALDLLEKIAKNEFILPDAPLLKQSDGVQSYTSSTSTFVPVVDIERRQW
jgi:hypothetical protein